MTSRAAGRQMLGLAADPLGDAATALLARFKLAMEASWKTDLMHAITLLEDGSAWKAESAALKMLRRLRLGELLQATGAAPRAGRLLQALVEELDGSPLQPLFLPHVDMALKRRAYARNPLDEHRKLKQLLQRSLLTAEGAADSVVRAEQFHLLFLCKRRALEQCQQRRVRRIISSESLRPLLESAQAAILLFLLTGNSGRAQHVCANLAYAHQKLAPDVHDSWLVRAVQWHASIALGAACRSVPSAAAPRTGSCVRVRPAASGRLAQGREWR